MEITTQSKLLQKWQALPESRRLALYAAFCLGASLLVTLGNYTANWHVLWLGRVVGLLVALAALYLAGRAARIPLRHRGSLPWVLLICLIPVLVYLVFRLGKVTQTPDMANFWWNLWSIVITALWEESVFRLYGRLLFEEEQQYKARNFLIIALIFGAMHLVNLLYWDIKTVLLQVVFAALMGLFFQTVYTWTGSLFLVVGLHALINAVQTLPMHWIWPTDRYLAGHEGLDMIICSLFFAISAALISRKGQIIKRGTPFLKLGKKS